MELIGSLGVRVLPNTAGCRTVKEAVTTAHMARELFATDWVKLEVIANDDTLQPDVFGLVEAAAHLTKDGFKVLPYTTEDLSVAERLLAAGCEVLMPWAAPIGSGRGLANPYALKSLRAYCPGVPLVIDAGIGAPSHAAEAMEMGYDAVLLNTAVAKAGDPVRMAAPSPRPSRRAAPPMRPASWACATWPHRRRPSPARRSSIWVLPPALPAMSEMARAGRTSSIRSCPTPVGSRASSRLGCAPSSSE